MIKIKNIMTENVISISENAKIIEAAKMMVSRNVSSLLVLKENMPVAIITENDIISNVISKNKNINTVKVKDAMNKNFKIINTNARYIDVIRDLRQNRIKRFPVVENNKLIGLITETDIVQATRDFTRFHQIMQEVILGIFGLCTAFFLFYFSPLGASIFR